MNDPKNPRSTRVELFLPGRRRVIVTLRGLRPGSITTVLERGLSAAS